jgi:hypothetical protein
MWIKKKNRATQERKVRAAKMPQALVEFEENLHKATSSDDENSLPNVAVIAADVNGWCGLSY